MSEEKLLLALPKLFREVKVPQNAKQDLRQRLFGSNQLSDDELSLVSAAGDLAEQRSKQNIKEE